MSQVERTPKDVARQSSIFIGVMGALATIAVLWLTEAFELWAVAIVVGVILEEISYFVIYSAVEKFIDHRIKVLYKTISKIKGGDEQSINMDEDVVETANQDVMEWAEDQIKEIAENIVKLIPTLLEKKIDLFSSKVNSNLLALI